MEEESRIQRTRDALLKKKKNGQPPLCLLDFGMLCFHFNLVIRILCFPF